MPSDRFRAAQHPRGGCRDAGNGQPGATWSSSSPDFGVQGCLTGFAQIAPRVLFAVNGYFTTARFVDTRAKVREIASRLPSVERVVWVEYIDAHPVDNAGAAHRDPVATDGDWSRQGAPAAVEQSLGGFSGQRRHGAELRALSVRSSARHRVLSGTTGLPKCMVHGAGGTLLQHVKGMCCQ